MVQSGQAIQQVVETDNAKGIASIFPSVHPEDKHTTDAVVAKAIEGPCETRVIYRSLVAGETVKLLLTGRPTYDVDQNWIGYVWSKTILPESTSGDRALLALLEHNLFSQKDQEYDVPTISFDLDGCLANRAQAILDLITANNPFAMYDWRRMNCTGDCEQCSSCICINPQSGSSLFTALTVTDYQRAQNEALNTPNFWTNIEPYDAEELQTIGYQMAGGRYAAVFVANRANLNFKGFAGDARLQSIKWLEDHGIVGALGVSCCSANKVLELLIRNVRYHIDDDVEEVAKCRAAGIEAFLLNRPWNKTAKCEYRVNSVTQFLEIAVPAPVEDLHYAAFA